LLSITYYFFQLRYIFLNNYITICTCFYINIKISTALSKSKNNALKTTVTTKW